MEKVVEKNTENFTTLYDINFQTNSYAAAAQRNTGTPGHVAVPAAPPPPLDKEIPTEDIKTYLSEEGIQNATV